MANIITITRIILSVILIILKPYTNLFLIIYTICGITDVLDGYVARKTNTQSELGARLDTIADIIFLSVMTIILFPIITQKQSYIIFLIIIAIIRIISILIIIKKYKKFAMLHTYSNKLTGLLLFTLPYFIFKINLDFIIYGICIIALLSAVEELIINLKSKKLDVDIKFLSIKKLK